MAAILGILGRDRRHGSGAWTVGRRTRDPQVAERRLVEDRLDTQARKLASYGHVRFPR